VATTPERRAHNITLRSSFPFSPRRRASTPSASLGTPPGRLTTPPPSDAEPTPPRLRTKEASLTACQRAILPTFLSPIVKLLRSPCAVSREVTSRVTNGNVGIGIGCGIPPNSTSIVGFGVDRVVRESGGSQVYGCF